MLTFIAVVGGASYLSGLGITWLGSGDEPGLSLLARVGITLTWPVSVPAICAREFFR